MITPPLPFQLRHDHPSIVASHARSHAAMALVRRARTATLGPLPPADTRSPGQRRLDDLRLRREQDQAIDLVTGDGPG